MGYPKAYARKFKIESVQLNLKLLLIPDFSKKKHTKIQQRDAQKLTLDLVSHKRENLTYSID